MTMKSRKELEHELDAIQALRAEAEDRLCSDHAKQLVNKLARAESVYQELQDQITEMTIQRSEYQTKLDGAISAAEDVDILGEEIANTNNVIGSIADELDAKQAVIATMQIELETLESRHSVLAEEIELARCTHERTDRMEKQLKNLEESIADLAYELDGVVDSKSEIEVRLQEAVEAKDSVGYIRESAETQSVEITEFEAAIVSLDEQIQEKSDLLVARSEEIAAIQEESIIEAERTNADSEALDEYIATVGSLKEQIAGAQQATGQLRPTSALHEEIERVTEQINQSADYQGVYVLESSLNKIGLTIQTTTNNRMILCKLRDNKPLVENVVDDYIFIGSLDTATKGLSECAVNKIVDFVRVSAGPAGSLKNVPRIWHNGLKIYGSTVPIMNEDKQYSVDMLVEFGNRNR